MTINTQNPHTELATNLQFPEGPIALNNGAILVVEIAAGLLTHISANGDKKTIASTGGGPNGAAIGPDGAVYICNNGGLEWHQSGGLTLPSSHKSCRNGSIQKINLETGCVETLYEEWQGNPLSAPNDIVFDRHGGFWFTDTGSHKDNIKYRGAVYYAQPDGSSIDRKIYPLEWPNGIGLSPDESTLYVADTHAARLWAYNIDKPGQPILSAYPWLGKLLYTASGEHFFDSLAVEANGTICVGTCFNGGGISRISADGSHCGFIPLPDIAPTNICFGGINQSVATITLSTTGKVVQLKWPAPGLRLNFSK